MVQINSIVMDNMGGPGQKDLETFQRTVYSILMFHTSNLYLENVTIISLWSLLVTEYLRAR
jgi:hypothetical protein